MDTSIEEQRQQSADQSEQANEIQQQFYQLGTEIARIEETLQFNQQRSQQLQEDQQVQNSGARRLSSS